MKLLFKFIFTFTLVPFFLFLKGEMSFHTFVEVNELDKSFANFGNTIFSGFEPKKYVSFKLPVKTISNNKNFNAAGLCISLYDENYQLLTQTQVSGKYINFILPKALDTNQTYHVVVPSTSDELTLMPGKEKEALLIYEAHLADN